MRETKETGSVKPPDRGVVVAVGDGIPYAGLVLPIPYQVGDTVMIPDVGVERIYLNPEDEYNTEAPKYLLVRCADTKGKILQ